uniref:Electron transfer flavoprotein alpha/beta-subunit N-terminal domain-containing protein n=1 Tax=Pseudo-nitzschia australis TaxID=44445 RepID=A0A7S4EF39_9STRA
MISARAAMNMLLSNGSASRTILSRTSMVGGAAATLASNFHKGAKMASTLVISEPLDTDGSTPAGTQSTVSAATQLNNGNEIHLLVVGGTSPSKVPSGVSKVFYVPIDDKLSETVANAVLEVVNDDCNVVVGTQSKFGSTVVPRAAALLDVSPVTDILEIEDEKTFVRPMYAGNVLGKVVAKPGPNGNDRKVLSIRPTCFDKAELIDSSSIDVETLEGVVQAFDKAEWVGESVSKSDRPDLSSASVVVSGGRGIKSGDNFPILEALADKLGVSVGFLLGRLLIWHCGTTVLNTPYRRAITICRYD